MSNAKMIRNFKISGMPKTSMFSSKLRIFCTHKKSVFCGNKGQLKIQEMAFVLLAIVFLFALVLLFFTAFQYRLWQNVAAETRESRAISLLEVISSMPELRCSSSFSSTSEAVCIDEDKLAYFNKSGNMRERYSILWQNSMAASIEIQQIYPSKKSYFLYTKPKIDELSTQTFSTYISICSEELKGISRCTLARVKARIIMPELK